MNTPAQRFADLFAFAGDEKGGYPNLCYAAICDGGTVLIDVADSRYIPALAGLPAPAHLLLTHRHTRRHEAEYERRFGVRIYLHPEDDRPRRCGPAMGTPAASAYIDPFGPAGSDTLARLGFHCLHIPGHTPGSTFYVWDRHGGVLFPGDAVVSAITDAGPELRFQPRYSDDHARNRASVCALSPPSVKHILPFHGPGLTDLNPADVTALWDRLRGEQAP